jgi:hypothetical protein
MMFLVILSAARDLSQKTVSRPTRIHRLALKLADKLAASQYVTLDGIDDLFF